MNEYECLSVFVENVKNLALLPAKEIEKVFDELVDKLCKLGELPVLGDENKSITPQVLFDNFIQYFKRYWLRQVTPDEFSVFLEQKRQIMIQKGIIEPGQK